MSRDFLLEIGTEEIPSGYLGPALRGMEKQWQESAGRNRIEVQRIRAVGTPRRLVLMAEGMAEEQKELVTKTLGPPVKVAFDQDGNPTKAAVGFAERCGVPLKDLIVEETDKGRYLCAAKVERGKEVFGLLPELVTEFIGKIPFPKSMRWGEGEARFVRPVHWLLCLYGERTVEFEYGGVRSGNLSRGHRFMAPDPFPVESPASYIAALGERFVVVDNEARKEMLKGVVDGLAGAHGGVACGDEELLDTVANLVEYPVGVWGSFDEEYLELPREVLVNAMVEHQRYIPVEAPDGALTPNFISISNTRARDIKVVAHGNEKVLRARLADGMFFFKEDTARPLEDYVDGLKRVLYQEKLGTSYEKMERFRDLALWLQSILDVSSPELVERAAILCKADLLTLMVYEFPKLQGVIGRVYALISGEKEEVAEAVYEHYLPRYTGDDLPETPTGAILSTADKLDTIVGSFGIGMRPTGNLDPHGLRRQAIGIINIVTDNAYRLSLSGLVDKALEILDGKITEDPGKVKAEVLDFFARRLENLFLSDGIRYDLVDAAMGAGFDDLFVLKLRLDGLREFARRPDFDALTTTFKRVVNIIPKERFADVRQSLFIEDDEGELYRKTLDVKNRLDGLLGDERYLEALAAIAELKGTVDRFFDSVLVMADDSGVRHNRLALLCEVAGLFSTVADFSKIVSGV